METFTLDNDIKVFYITATSFPDGIMDAHQKLHVLVPFSTQRKYFGISRPENGHDIIYRAATEETYPGEAETYHCETLILKKGSYISTTLHDYMKDLSIIGRTFDELLTHPDIDPNGYCVEWYLNQQDVKCMIRLNQSI